MTTRSIPSRAVDYTSRSGQTYHLRSATEEAFAKYLDRHPQPWSYEPERIGGYLCDFRVLTTPLVWFEIKPDGFLGWSGKEYDDTLRKIETLRQARPADRVCLMPWHWGWTKPQGPFLLSHPSYGWLRVEREQSTPFAVAA